MHVDAGAEKALAAGKSLLPAGVARIEGDFDRGDAVVIRAPDGHELGRGLIAYARTMPSASSAGKLARSPLYWGVAAATS